MTDQTGVLSLETFVRKPFEVEAVQVSLDNIETIAQWCEGTLHDKGATPRFPATRYIRVPVKRPQSHRQTLAYPGDWVLYNGKGFKVYTNEAFEKSFDKK